MKRAARKTAARADADMLYNELRQREPELSRQVLRAWSREVAKKGNPTRRVALRKDQRTTVERLLDMLGASS